MDPVKEAFLKIKEDMSLFRAELQSLKEGLSSISDSLQLLKSQMSTFPTTPTQNPSNSSVPTDIPAQVPTVPQEIRGFPIAQNYLSTGNKGVPTDKSTNSQTVQQTHNSGQKDLPKALADSLNIQYTLDSLDAIKKDIRLKFKRLTTQEMLVFSTMYSLETQGFEEITYKTIANNLNLSESSIRDYVNKLLTKGIPILKTRLNNKKIALNISPDLQKIASLSTIVRLRDI